MLHCCCPRAPPLPFRSPELLAAAARAAAAAVLCVRPRHFRAAPIAMGHRALCAAQRTLPPSGRWMLSRSFCARVLAHCVWPTPFWPVRFTHHSDTRFTSHSDSPHLHVFGPVPPVCCPPGTGPSSGPKRLPTTNTSSVSAEPVRRPRHTHAHTGVCGRRRRRANPKTTKRPKKAQHFHSHSLSRPLSLHP